LVGGAHIVAFVCWQTPGRRLAAPVAVREAITYILAPTRLAPPERRNIAQKTPQRSPPLRTGTARDLPKLRDEPAAPVPTPPSLEAATQPQAITQAAPPPDPFAPPVKPEDDLKQRALKSAFAVDKQLRKESWTQRDRKIVNDTTALAAAFDKAYVGGGSGEIGEITMADGKRVTKWRMPGGLIVCISKDPNNSGRTSITSCP
jgi:hypothetical protein